MGTERISSVNIKPAPLKPRAAAVSQAILFIIPSIVITSASIILFQLLQGFTASQQNIFSMTIISAVILSLIGTSGVQILIYRIIDLGERGGTGASAKRRSLRLGFLYSFVVSLFLAAIFYPILINVLGFGITDYVYFTVLLFVYSLVWVITSTLWATSRYLAPAIVFTIGYIAIVGLTYAGNRAGTEFTITGYTAGTVLLLILAYTAYLGAVGKNDKTPVKTEQQVLSKLIAVNVSAIFFQIFYVVAIFLDKIIVWVSDGISSGQGLIVQGPYSYGSFLGLIPVFCVAGVAYFSNRIVPVTEHLFEGTLSEINQRVKRYQQLYYGCWEIILVLWFLLFVGVGLFTFFYDDRGEIFRVFLIVALGSLFFAIIVFNSVVLPLFHKTNISAIAMLIICLCELATVTLVSSNTLFAALGFSAGAFLGFLVSQVAVVRMFNDFQYRLFAAVLTAQ